MHRTVLEPGPGDLATRPARDVNQPVIELSRLQLRFGKVPVLSDVNVTIPRPDHRLDRAYRLRQVDTASDLEPHERPGEGLLP